MESLAAAAVLGMLCSQLTRAVSAACVTHSSVALPAQNNYEEQDVQRFQLSYLKCMVALLFLTFGSPFGLQTCECEFEQDRSCAVSVWG